jgi:hypothetical protein
VAPNTVTAVGMAFISAMQNHPEHVRAVLPDGHDDRRARHLAVLGLLLEGGGLVHPAPDDVTGHHDQRAEPAETPSRRKGARPSDWALWAGGQQLCVGAGYGYGRPRQTVLCQRAHFARTVSVQLTYEPSRHHFDEETLT